MFQSAWLIGEGRWGSKIHNSLDQLGIKAKVIDIRNGSSIWNVDDLDPVIIATPTSLHYDHARHFMSRGHHVFIEKPACETPDKISALIAIRRQGQIVMPGHIYMFNPLLDRLQQIISAGRIGEVRFIHSERTNLGTYQSNNLLLNNIGLHDISIIEYIWKIASVDVAKFIDISNDGMPDRACIMGKTAKGIDWQLDISWLSAARRRMMTVAGTLGQIVWDDDQRSLTVTTTDTQQGNLTYERLPTEYAEGDMPLVRELEHFFSCACSGTQPKVSLEDSLRVSQIIADSERAKIIP